MLSSDRRGPLNFWALNANSSKTVEVTNFKFGTRTRRVSPVMTPKFFFEKGAWPGSRDPVNYWALNANSSKMAKDAHFKFGKHAPTDSPDVTPEKMLDSGLSGVGRL